jgi:hypothetical protein
MLETMIVILVILWLLGFFGGRRLGWGGAGRGTYGGLNLVHILLIIAVILLIVRLLR